jgi:hypothetical protein
MVVQKFTIDYHKIKIKYWTFKSLSSFSALESEEDNDESSFFVKDWDVWWHWPSSWNRCRY